jgi:hypothetical protein
MYSIVTRCQHVLLVENNATACTQSQIRCLYKRKFDADINLEFMRHFESLPLDSYSSRAAHGNSSISQICPPTIRFMKVCCPHFFFAAPALPLDCPENRLSRVLELFTVSPVASVVSRTFKFSGSTAKPGRLKRTERNENTLKTR